jgi:hypothetical protein
MISSLLLHHPVSFPFQLPKRYGFTPLDTKREEHNQANEINNKQTNQDFQTTKTPEKGNEKQTVWRLSFFPALIFGNLLG